MNGDYTIAYSYKYKIEMYYVNTINNTTSLIKNESLKSLIIDHNYDKNSMPIIYANIVLDRALIDNMILNIDKNYIILALYKYDELMDHVLDIECFRDTFTYFLPDDVNKNNDLDYNETTNEQNLGDTYKCISLGLLSIKHINNNKRCVEANLKNTSMAHIVKYCTSHFDNLLIEPFNYNDTFDQLIIPPQDSIRKTLEYLNNYRVFYKTPFRYYQDFSCTYIISSSGIAIPRKNDKYNSIIFDINELSSIYANDPGMELNKSREHYKVPVNYLDTNVYDNSISNKSKNAIKGITSTGNVIKSLNSNADYSTTKIKNIRLNNDNEHMMENIVSDFNSSNIYVNISKNNLDTDLFTINKRYSINHIERYMDFNGNYLLCRKREIYMRQDDTFIMNMILNMRMVGYSE